MTNAVTDDEAFIRTIVASPGDDAPRLVYADWLEERGDESGAYLRREVEWAKSCDQELETRLRMTANGLDAVWVARVSRPPMGVCCDHLRFSESGPPIAEQQLGAFEAEATVRNAKYGGHTPPLFNRLPAEYRAIVMNHNGGYGEECSFPVPGVMDSRPFVAQTRLRFHRFGKDTPLEDPTGPWGLWLTLASSAKFENTSYRDKLLLRLDREHIGKVYLLAESRTHVWEWGEFPEVAASLSAFFGILKPLSGNSEFSSKRIDS